MKTLIVVVAIAAFAAYAWYLLPSPLRADVEQPAAEHVEHPGDPFALAIGMVVSVDRVLNSVTISHGPLYNLRMPPMTMGFLVADPALLQGIEAGQKVKFHADTIGGTLVVMKIETMN
jgi:Cu/Ag efflux protein CusF